MNHHTQDTSLFAAAAEERPFVVEAHRSASSMFGAASELVKGPDGRPMRFATLREARAQATKWNASLVTKNVCYVARPSQEGR